MSIVRSPVTSNGSGPPWQFEAVSEGRSAALSIARRVAPWPCAVLISGPTGVGKDVLAEDIHRHSRRAGGPFVPLNCAALPNGLFESEMFGHARGAFTGAAQNKPGLVELAHDGTLFLDEIGELPLGAQAKLLRFLGKGTYWPVGATAERRADVRVIAATNRILAEEAGRGFRTDLYYRLSTITIDIPELASEDAERIAHTLLRELHAEYGTTALPADLDKAARRCGERRWPGGVREMKSALERSLLLGWDDEADPAEDGWPPPVAGAPAPDLKRLERIGNLLFMGLLREAGSVRGMAMRMQCTPQAIYSRLHRMGIGPRDITGQRGIERRLTALREEVRELMPWVQSVLRG